MGERFATLPPGPWSDPPDKAVVVPIPSNRPHEPAGLMVAGVSARLRWDESYRVFFELLTTQVATAVANARAYEEEKERAEALTELDRAKTAFFSNVSHEFRTPLTLILGPLEDALAETREPRQRDRLEMLHRNALRLQKLVNTLLDFSRIEAGRIQASYDPTDLAELTTELASVFRSAVEKAGLRLSVHCPPLGEPVYVDRDMYEKVVLNLLSNAFKFTLEGEIAVTLRDAGGDSGLVAEMCPAAASADRRPRIVWADDSADMRDYVGRLLGRLYDVEALADGEAALAAVRRHPPDLVLADVMMPQLDGFELLRADDRTSTIPVILLSAKPPRAWWSRTCARAPSSPGNPPQAVLLDAGVRAVQSTPLLSSAGNVLGVISTHFRQPHRPSERELRLMDLLARQVADYLERRQADVALRESEQRFRVLFEAMDEGYCVIEMLFDERNNPVDYRFLEINPAFGKQTGIQDAKGRLMREIAPTHEQHWFDIYGQIALTGETRRFENPAAALGRYYDVCAFRVGPPELRRVGIVFNDITERKRTEEAIRRSKEALLEADRRKDEFLATLAHELRNPLAPIRNRAPASPTLSSTGVAARCDQLHTQSFGRARRSLSRIDVWNFEEEAPRR